MSFDFETLQNVKYVLILHMTPKEIRSFYNILPYFNFSRKTEASELG